MSKKKKSKKISTALIVLLSSLVLATALLIYFMPKIIANFERQQAIEKLELPNQEGLEEREKQLTSIYYKIITGAYRSDSSLCYKAKFMALEIDSNSQKIRRDLLVNLKRYFSNMPDMSSDLEFRWASMEDLKRSGDFDSEQLFIRDGCYIGVKQEDGLTKFMIYSGGDGAIMFDYEFEYDYNTKEYKYKYISGGIS